MAETESTLKLVFISDLSQVRSDLDGIERKPLRVKMKAEDVAGTLADTSRRSGGSAFSAGSPSYRSGVRGGLTIDERKEIARENRDVADQARADKEIAAEKRRQASEEKRRSAAIAKAARNEQEAGDRAAATWNKVQLSLKLAGKGYADQSSILRDEASLYGGDSTIQGSRLLLRAKQMDSLNERRLAKIRSGQSAEPDGGIFGKGLLGGGLARLATLGYLMREGLNMAVGQAQFQQDIALAGNDQRKILNATMVYRSSLLSTPFVGQVAELFDKGGETRLKRTLASADATDANTTSIGEMARYKHAQEFAGQSASTPGAYDREVAAAHEEYRLTTENLDERLKAAYQAKREQAQPELKAEMAAANQDRDARKKAYDQGLSRSAIRHDIGAPPINTSQLKADLDSAQEKVDAIQKSIQSATGTSDAQYNSDRAQILASSAAVRDRRLDDARRANAAVDFSHGGVLQSNQQISNNDSFGANLTKMVSEGISKAVATPDPNMQTQTLRELMSNMSTFFAETRRNNQFSKSDAESSAIAANQDAGGDAAGAIRTRGAARIFQRTRNLPNNPIFNNFLGGNQLRSSIADEENAQTQAELTNLNYSNRSAMGQLLTASRTASLVAERKPYAAQAAEIEGTTMNQLGQLRDLDPMKWIKEFNIRRLGLSQLKSLTNQLQYAGSAEEGVAGTIGPGFSDSGTESVGDARKAIEEASKNIGGNNLVVDAINMMHNTLMKVLGQN